ncbi:MAG: hypothetical protein COA42_14595, partial [Alteromonadaceae bacterium]
LFILRKIWFFGQFLVFSSRFSFARGILSQSLHSTQATQLGSYRLALYRHDKKDIKYIYAPTF